MKIKKIVALMLALAMVVSGLYLVTPDTSEVKAADTTQSSSDALEPNTVADGMLNVKMQIQTNQGSEKYADDSVNLRLVSSVNGLGYKNVGFEVYLDLDNNKEFDKSEGSKEYTKFTTGDVSKRINASVTGVTYNYSPKVIDTDAEYFISGTLMGINKDHLSKDMYVRAFCTTMGDEVVYGTGRYFNIADATAKNIINIPVEMDAEPTEEDVVTINDIETEATLVKYDGTYAHLNVTVPDNWANKTALPSASKIVVGSDENAPSAIYRNLLSDYTGTPDTSWYTEYKEAGETEFVIATDADLYGFSTLGQTKTFSGDTIYAVADIDANIGRADATGWLNTDAEGATIEGCTSYSWTPIGTSTASFVGTFDGQMHTIGGLYFNETVSTESSWGLFGVTGNCTVQNLTLANSYMKITASTLAYLGGIAGTSNGMFETIKVADDVYVNHTKTNGTSDHTGGIVGYMTGTSADAREISNCWFSGTIAGRESIGGILGTTNNTPLNYPTTIDNCLNTGTMEISYSSGYIIGGLCGDINGSQLVLTNSVNAALYNQNNKTVSYYGSAIGRIRYNVTAAKGLTATINNTYAVNSERGWKRFASGTSLGEYSLDGNTTLYTGAIIESVCSTPESIKSGNSYCNMNFDFTIKDVYEGVWTVTKDTPVLSSFVSDEEILDLDEVTTPRTLWYTKAAEGTQEYILYSTADMFGFASLVNSGTSFSGKTVKLGADITMNKGQATAKRFEPEVDGTEPFPWTPMKIEGTFDGDDHTIRGVYLDSDAGNIGLFTTVSGTVQNLRLQNSCFNCTKADSSGYNSTNYTNSVGSIAASLDGGTLNTVYSDAFVNHAGCYVGGLVGVISSGTTNTITNSCYAGKVVGSQLVGGILGGLVGAQASITHCLNVGDVTGSEGTGGLCGYVDNRDAKKDPALTLTDSLSVGELKATDSQTWRAATVGFSRCNEPTDEEKTNEDYDECAILTNVYAVNSYANESNPWLRFASGGTWAYVQINGASYKGSVNESEYFWGIQAIKNKQTADETVMNLSFQSEEAGADNTDNYWVDRTGQIPMLASFEDLLTNVTY